MGQACLICRGTESRSIFDEWGIDVLRCRRCGHVFSSYDAEADYDGYWGEAIDDPGREFWLDAHRAMYEDFFRLVATKPEGRLLDVGCGLGFFVGEAQSRLSGWESHGYEISPAAVRYGSEKLGIKNLHAGRVEESEFPAQSFDMITLWDVLEHLRDPEPLLEYSCNLLKPGGTCFVHTPNVQIQVPKARLRRLLRGMREGEHYLEAKDHLHLYSPRTLDLLLKRSGFDGVEFLHLPPTQRAMGVSGRTGIAAKNLWFRTVRSLDGLTAGRVNLDNLFVAARRAARD